MRWIRYTVTALSVVAFSTTVMAKQSQSHDSKSVSSQAKKLVKKVAGGDKIQVDQSFSSIGNLDGFVVSKKGDKQSPQGIIYADDQGRYLVSGNIISPKGKNISQQDHNKYITSKEAPKILKAAKKTHYFEEGKQDASHKAYILIEPNCIACHSLYEKIHSSIKSGKLAVRWIPVAFRKQSSMGKAAAILSSDDPAKALQKNEKGFDAKSETGGIKPKDNVPSDLKKQIKSNMQFMMNNDIRVTPVIIYKDSSGKAQIQKGAPRNKQGVKDLLDKMSSSF